VTESHDAPVRTLAAVVTGMEAPVLARSITCGGGAGAPACAVKVRAFGAAAIADVVLMLSTTATLDARFDAAGADRLTVPV
jgi:hypothetical protein